MLPCEIPMTERRGSKPNLVIIGLIICYIKKCCKRFYGWPNYDSWTLHAQVHAIWPSKVSTVCQHCGHDKLNVFSTKISADDLLEAVVHVTLFDETWNGQELCRGCVDTMWTQCRTFVLLYLQSRPFRHIECYNLSLSLYCRHVEGVSEVSTAKLYISVAFCISSFT